MSFRPGRLRRLGAPRIPAALLVLGCDEMPMLGVGSVFPGSGNAGGIHDPPVLVALKSCGGYLGF